uniref:Class I SAM-dependent methyltransferase n=1 Tax=Thermus caliditerrae TaxID=1330700 RepID=A0A7C5VF07_9DEIN
MRLEGRSKAGFYPTPPRTLEGLAALLEEFRERFQGRPVLDPCAGEGEAIARVAQALGSVPYAVELDEERARACRKALAPLSGKVLQGDSLEMEGGGFGLLWLNPPYDWAEGGGEKAKRLERIFLEHWWEALVPGGLLVLLVPEGVAEDLWGFLAPRASHAVAFRLPEEEYGRFRQVVLLAVRALYSWQSVEEAFRVSPWERGLERARRVLEEVWPARGGEIRPSLRPRPKDLEASLGEARFSPLWEAVEAACVKESAVFRPLLPLRQAHLALLVAGGLLDLQEIELEGEPHAVLGVLRKDVVTVEEEEERSVKRVEREVFRAGLVLLNLRTGAITEVR